MEDVDDEESGEDDEDDDDDRGLCFCFLPGSFAMRRGRVTLTAVSYSALDAAEARPTSLVKTGCEQVAEPSGWSRAQTSGCGCVRPPGEADWQGQ
jgi:hypothetical protein